jgi:hypothetical protein
MSDQEVKMRVKEMKKFKRDLIMALKIFNIDEAEVEMEYFRKVGVQTMSIKINLVDRSGEAFMNSMKQISEIIDR